MGAGRGPTDAAVAPGCHAFFRRQVPLAGFPLPAARRLSAPSSPPPAGSNAHLPGMSSPHSGSNRETEQLGPCPDGRRCPRARALDTTRCKVKTQGPYKTRRLSRRKTFGQPTRWPGRGSQCFLLLAAVDLGKKDLVQTLLWVYRRSGLKSVMHQLIKGEGGPL